MTQPDQTEPDRLAALYETARDEDAVPTKTMAVTAPASTVRRLFAWAAHVGLERKAALALAGASTLSGFVTYFILTRTPPGGLAPGMVVALLTLNLVLILVFGAVVANQLVQVWVQRRRGLAGSRLHVRLVVLFSVVAVAPTVVVAIFSYVLLSIGMESWFSDKVRTALSESQTVAQAYLQEHRQNIRADADVVSRDISDNILRIAGHGPAALDALISQEVGVRSLTEAIVFDDVTGTILGHSELSFSLEFDSPQPADIARAAAGETVIVTSQNRDRVRALVKIDGIPNALLYVGRPVDPMVLNHMAATNEAVDQYERLESQRSNYQITFIVIFGAVALLFLLVAVWFGLNFATEISRRISGLVVAAERVRSGDLSARVAEVAENDEFGSLSRAFNRMTGQLQSQQGELVEANRQLDLRRRFTEAVLSGVSAGVLGLDEQGLINLPNHSASALTGIEFEQLLGKPLAEIVPEMAPLIEEALLSRERLVEGQIRVQVRSRSMMLLVRISAERGTERGDHARGFVVTFDDITELLGAQRKAAWADVARRIAHEMKNPLTPIQLSAERLKRKYLKEITTDPETFAICTDTIIRQVGDIGRMVDEFSSFARMPTPVMKPENLLDITRQAVFLQRNAHADISFDLEMPLDAVTVNCDARQVSQALINLLQNAIDSIHARQVAQTGAGLPPGPGHIRVGLDDVSGRVFLSVEDNGKGLPRQGRENLTEPYVTTRAKGTGLGLAIVKKIMEDHAGELMLDDGAEGGARVSLVFPASAVSRRPPQQQAEPIPAETVAHGA